MLFQFNHSLELDIFAGIVPKYEHDLFLTLSCCSIPCCAATNYLYVIVLGHTICSLWSVGIVITKGLRCGYFLLYLSVLCQNCSE
jgi:hypothetical protein